jgi:hypothetical protein
MKNLINKLLNAYGDRVNWFVDAMIKAQKEGDYNLSQIYADTIREIAT